MKKAVFIAGLFFAMASFKAKASIQPFALSVKAEGTTATIKISGAIYQWRNSASDFESQVSNLITQGVVNVTLYLNSPGGDCFEANEIANIIKKFPGTIKGEGGAMVGSAATYLACICSEFKIAPNGQFMIHKPMMSTEGNYDEISARLKALKNLQDDYAKVYAAKTKMTVKQIEALWIEDYWMNADESISKGFADGKLDNAATITQDDVANAKAFYESTPAEFTANTTITKPNNSNTNEMEKAIFIAMFSLAKDATDAQIIAKIEEMKAKAAMVDGLQNKLTIAEKAVTDAQALANNVRDEAFLTKAIEAKKFPVAQKEFYAKNLKSDFEGTKALIDSMPGIAPLSTAINNTDTGAVDRSTWTYADYQEKDPAALAELNDKDEAKFKALFAAHYKIKL